MKFIRRHDLTPHTRIEMVRLAWLNQGIYGKMTQIAQDYHISRTFLYQLIWAALVPFDVESFCVPNLSGFLGYPLKAGQLSVGHVR
jgi:hypothetical protein